MYVINLAMFLEKNELRKTKKILRRINELKTRKEESVYRNEMKISFHDVN